MGKICVAVVVVLASSAAAVAYGSVSATPRPRARTLRFVIDGRSVARRFPDGTSIAFRYPANWDVTTRRLDVVLDPHTLFAVSTYKLPIGPRHDATAHTVADARPTARSWW